MARLQLVHQRVDLAQAGRVGVHGPGAEGEQRLGADDAGLRAGLPLVSSLERTNERTFLHVRIYVGVFVSMSAWWSACITAEHASA